MLKMITREQCQVRTRQRKRQGKNMIWDTLAFNLDDMRYSYSGVTYLQRQALSKEIWLSKFEERCLFGFRTSNPVEDLALEIRRAVSLRFLRKYSCWESGSRDSEGGASSIFEHVILLGVWLSRFRERCLFDF
ncbi:hypothetical protein ACFX12_032797 [Malus domestica]